MDLPGGAPPNPDVIDAAAGVGILNADTDELDDLGAAGDGSEATTSEADAVASPAPGTADADDYATDDEIEQYLASKGYGITKPGARVQQQAAPAPAASPVNVTHPGAAPSAADFDTKFEALKKEYGEKYAESYDDEEKFSIQAEFQRQVTKLQIEGIQKAAARAELATAIPEIEAQLKEKGLPVGAARHYAAVMADFSEEERGLPQVKQMAMDAALGRALRESLGKQKADPSKIKLPTGEGLGGAPRGAGSGKYSPADVAEAKRHFQNEVNWNDRKAVDSFMAAWMSG